MSADRLYRQVVEQVSQLIESGEFPVGSRLPRETELAERFNVSRPTVREAMIALETVGKVTVRSGSGLYVASKSGIRGVAEHLDPFELLESRVLIEGEAAALAASLISAQQLKALEDTLDRMAHENTVGETTSDSADRKFHAIIADAANNRMLQSLIEGLWDMQSTQAHIQTARHSICKRDPDVRLGEHWAIYEALASRDAAAARRAMRQHFARAIEVLHTTTEQEAVAEVKRHLTRTRERFSSDRMIDSGASAG